MKLLALDLATATGWAVGRHDGRPLFGTHKLPSTGEDIGRFLVAFETFLTDLMVLESPDRVVFEAPIFLGGGASNIMTARKLMGLANHTEYVCHLRNVECRQGHLQRVKKFFSGHGRAEKTDMMAAAKRLGFEVKTSDEADAIGLWAYSVHQWFPSEQHRWSLGQMGAAA